MIAPVVSVTTMPTGFLRPPALPSHQCWTCSISDDDILASNLNQKAVSGGVTERPGALEDDILIAQPGQVERRSGGDSEVLDCDRRARVPLARQVLKVREGASVAGAGREASRGSSKRRSEEREGESRECEHDHLGESERCSSLTGKVTAQRAQAGWRFYRRRPSLRASCQMEKSTLELGASSHRRTGRPLIRSCTDRPCLPIDTLAQGAGAVLMLAEGT